MSLELTKLIVKAVKERKASRVVLLGMGDRSDVCDYQLICSGDSDKQTRAICDHVESLCRAELKLRPAVIEGRASGHWVLLDYGSILVHIFLTQLRDYYAVESLWPGSLVDLATME